MRLLSESINSVIRTLVVVSGIYFLTAVVTFKLLMPMQVRFLGELPYAISLLFFPHSVRILSAYFLGGLSVLYLFPISLLFVTQMKSSDLSMLGMLLLAGLISSVGYLGIRVAFLFKKFFTPSMPERKDWIFILIAGAIASILNALGHMIILGIEGNVLVGYFIGDMSGLFFSLIFLIYMFRILERCRSTS